MLFWLWTVTGNICRMYPETTEGWSYRTFYLSISCSRTPYQKRTPPWQINLAKYSPLMLECGLIYLWLKPWLEIAVIFKAIITGSTRMEFRQWKSVQCPVSELSDQKQCKFIINLQYNQKIMSFVQITSNAKGKLDKNKSL